MVLTPAMKRNFPVPTTIRRCAGVWRMLNTLVCSPLPSCRHQLGPSSLTALSFWEIPPCLTLLSSTTQSRLRGLDLAPISHLLVPCCRQLLRQPMFVVRGRTLALLCHQSSPPHIHKHLSVTVPLKSLPHPQATSPCALHHLHTLTWAALIHVVLMIHSLAHAPFAPLHHQLTPIVRTFHGFVEFANVSVLQVSSLPAKVKPSVRNSVVVARNLTAALRVQSTKHTTTALPTRHSHLFTPHTLPARTSTTTTLAATMVLSMFLGHQLLVQAMDTTEYLFCT